MSLIAILSVAVISLVVTLLLLFHSVNEGIQTGWKKKLTALRAPIQITPKDAYYHTKYYEIDRYASASDFSLKTLGEKLLSTGNPYNPEVDEELPSRLLSIETNERDLVKELYQTIKRTDWVIEDYESSAVVLQLHLDNGGHRSNLTQALYLTTFGEKNEKLFSLIEKPRPQDAPFLPFKQEGLLHLPQNGILLPKHFQESGAKVGDLGHIIYGAATFSSVQEMRYEVKICGFYDAGVLSVGPKCAYVPKEIVRHINSSGQALPIDRRLTNGFHIYFNDFNKTPLFAEELNAALEENHLSEYFEVIPYYEYDFAKDLFTQFKSDSNLFNLVGIIILIVACCNIISLLTLLVNDKKKEIGILQAMGATPSSIALIFSFCGIFIGLFSVCIGTFLAFLILSNLDTLVQLMSRMQGYDLFNAAFYGDSLPTHFSGQALLFTLLTTPILSLLAGLVPALKAARMNPCEILRSE
ncbi:MAG: ABC transporter permease [Simkaniaceae bacterium]|nr:ABC transporter permease [Simkaniaceae bacterium]